MTTKSLTVGLVQHACTEDRERNLDVSVQGIREAAARGARLVLLPELHTGVYFCQTEDTARFDQAEPVPGPSTELLGNLARELGITIVGSLFEKRAPGIYHNTAVILDLAGRLAGRYRKMHIPDDPLYHEKLDYIRAHKLTVFHFHDHFHALANFADFLKSELLSFTSLATSMYPRGSDLTQFMARPERANSS